MAGQENRTAVENLQAATREFDGALREATAPMWNWLEARSPRQFGAMLATTFLALIALAILSGSVVPVALGVAAWFLAAYLITRS